MAGLVERLPLVFVGEAGSDGPGQLRLCLPGPERGAVGGLGMTASR